MANGRNRVLWALAARQDLIDIWRYFASVASPEVADNLLREIEHAAERLLISPEMFPVRRDLMPDLPDGLRSVPIHPYTMFYRIALLGDAKDTDVQIIRVLHERRDFLSTLTSET
jgi:plasmid stabilization system protein ParE